jgi:hypothetical protein
VYARVKGAHTRRQPAVALRCPPSQPPKSIQWLLRPLLLACLPSRRRCWYLCCASFCRRWLVANRTDPTVVSQALEAEILKPRKSPASPRPRPTRPLWRAQAGRRRLGWAQADGRARAAAAVPGELVLVLRLLYLVEHHPPFKMPTRFSNTRKHRGHVSAFVSSFPPLGTRSSPSGGGSAMSVGSELATGA